MVVCVGGVVGCGGGVVGCGGGVVVCGGGVVVCGGVRWGVEVCSGVCSMGPLKFFLFTLHSTLIINRMKIF